MPWWLEELDADGCCCGEDDGSESNGMAMQKANFGSVMGLVGGWMATRSKGTRLPRWHISMTVI